MTAVPDKMCMLQDAVGRVLVQRRLPTSSREGEMSSMSLDEMRAGGLASNMERYLDVFCDERVVQTYGEAICWDDVIKPKATVSTINISHL